MFKESLDKTNKNLEIEIKVKDFYGGIGKFAAQQKSICEKTKDKTARLHKYKALISNIGSYVDKEFKGVLTMSQVTKKSSDIQLIQKEINQLTELIAAEKKKQIQSKKVATVSIVPQKKENKKTEIISRGGFNWKRTGRSGRKRANGVLDLYKTYSSGAYVMNEHKTMQPAVNFVLETTSIRKDIDQVPESEKNKISAYALSKQDQKRLIEYFNKNSYFKKSELIFDHWSYPGGVILVSASKVMKEIKRKMTAEEHSDAKDFLDGKWE